MRRPLIFALFATLVIAGALGAQPSTTSPTNMRYNAEATGNVLTLPFTLHKPAANCDADVAYSAEWYTNAAAAPTYACISGSNVLTARLQFSDSATNYIWTEFPLPSDWTGAIDLLVFWRTSATSNSVVWQAQTACSAVGESIDPAWNTANTVTDAAQGSANSLDTAAFSSLTTTGCAAGEMLWLRILRDPSNGSDNLGAAADFLGAQITYRRAI